VWTATATGANPWIVSRWNLGPAAVLVAVCLAATAAATNDEPIPWPRGQAPTPRELSDKVGAAFELFELERAEEFLEAFEAGEASEHVVVRQETIDRGDHDPEALFQFGDSTFEHAFSRRDGYGAGLRPVPQRVHDGHYGGLDGFSCAGCHARGGVNGAGSATANTFYFGDGERVSSAVVRNPPAVLGLGYVQLLGVEMTGQLQRLRDRAIAEAAKTSAPVTVELEAKGVTFGHITASPNGSLDESAITGVDGDLVVRPFGWKGHTARLRRFGERAARIHFGMQSHVLALEHQEDPDPGLLGWGKNWWDPDADGVQRELEEGTVTALAVYMALLETPVMIPPHDGELRERWARGSLLFDRLGCSDCHRRAMALRALHWRESPDTTDGPGVLLNLTRDGEPPRSSHEVMLFSDLRRHDMGDELADTNDGPTGVARYEFLTRPLWGLAESAPYLHDGRAATIPEAILAHGGEAAPQRASFEALGLEQRRDVHVFLLSLTREPKLRVPR
jgi:Di-haem oxidoreductase, putative peroxidase